MAKDALTMTLQGSATKHLLYDHGITTFKIMNENRRNFQQQGSIVFLSQNLLKEYHKRVNNLGIYFRADDQNPSIGKFLTSTPELEVFCFLNLVRCAPTHCANTVFEIMRNRYDH